MLVTVVSPWKQAYHPDQGEKVGDSGTALLPAVRRALRVRILPRLKQIGRRAGITGDNITDCRRTLPVGVQQILQDRLLHSGLPDSQFQIFSGGDIARDLSAAQQLIRLLLTIHNGEIKHLIRSVCGERLQHRAKCSIRAVGLIVDHGGLNGLERSRRIQIGKGKMEQRCQHKGKNPRPDQYIHAAHGAEQARFIDIGKHMLHLNSAGAFR